MVINKVSLNEKIIYIAREGKNFKILNQNLELMYEAFGTKQIAEIYSELFDFKLLLIPQKGGDSSIAYPNQMLLPFYLDQDESWNKIMGAFSANIKQFKSPLKETLEYYLGILDIEKYEIENSIKKIANDDRLILSDIEKYKELVEISSDIEKCDIPLDIENFKFEVSLIEEKLEKLRKSSNDCRNKKIDNYREMKYTQNQINVLNMQLKEVEKDFEYSKNIENNQVECPTCGVIHNNSFVERLNIANDEEEIKKIVYELKIEEKKLEEEKNKIEIEFKKLELELDNIEKIKKGSSEKPSLDKLLIIEGKKAFVKEIRKKIEVKEKERKICSENIRELNDSLKKLEKKEKLKRKGKLEEYAIILNNYLIDLDIFDIEVKKYLKNFIPTLKESGSDGPRTILGHFLAVNKLIYENDNVTKFPLIIDTPLQQDQDLINTNKIFNNIFSTNKNIQKIIGTVNVDKVPEGANIIHLIGERNALNKNEYSELIKVYNFIFEKTFL